MQLNTRRWGLQMTLRPPYIFYLAMIAFRRDRIGPVESGGPAGQRGVRLTMGTGPSGGRYWVRTSDLFGVNEARYHCANRPLRQKP